MTTAPGFAVGGGALVDILKGYEDEGYVAQFVAGEDATVRCLTCRVETPAGEVAIHALRRTEGASDPADMAAVAALCCPACSAKGTIVLKFGPESGIEEADVLANLDRDERLEREPASGGVGAGVEDCEPGVPLPT